MTNYMSLNFPLILVIAVFVAGIVALIDIVWLAPKRRQAVAAYKQQVATANHEVIEQLSKAPLLAEYGRSLFPVLAIVLVLRSFLFEPFQIPSGSMIPTLVEGDFILVNKFAYGIRLPAVDIKVMNIGTPQRGDVMVFKYPEDPRINYIKRVIGLPGDTIRYTSDRRVFVNGQPVVQTLVGEEPGSLGGAHIFSERLGENEYQIRKMRRTRIEPTREWKVPEGHYFTMGDNRDNSRDSRYWDASHIAPELQGMVPDEYIVGKASVIWVTWSAPKLSKLPHFERVGLIK